jgi:subtilisin family serine protease
MSFAGSTSFASLHAAGTAALIISADPSLGPDGVEDILYTTALCIDDSSCYGGPCPLPNNVYGHGRIDAFEAVSYTLSILAPFDLPWLGETPISGTLDAGMGVAIQVTFDTAGLATGVYTGALGIASSDPITPLVSVPVTLNVLPTPHIVIAPQSFSAILPVGGIQTDTLTISNDGDATLSFTLYETSTHGLMAPLLSVPGSPANPYPSGTPIQVEALARTQVLFLGRARLIIYLRLQPDLSGAYAFPSQAQRAQFVYDRLLETAALSDDLYNWLVSQGAEPHRLLTANAIAATLDAAQLEAVAARPEVGRIGINGYAHAITDGGGAMANVPAPLTVEWNIARIRADEAWSVFGVTGARAVVGEIDTGVMYTHPALISQYRGNLGGGNYDHNYNWYDFINNMPAPYDDHSHGTFGMGVAVGDDGLGNQIGVAPGAQWMAVKALDAGGGGTLEDLHAALQWMLAPTDLTGANPDPSKAPDVVLNMWGISSYYCDHYFDLNLTVLRAANILPVFAPGGEGPGCGTVATPAADPNALSAGATDNSDTIAPFSANGPSCYDGSIKPDLAAPGAEIRSSTNDGSYQVWSGTSFSTAHLAGAAALLFSANPDISLDTLEQNLFDTAVCHEPAYCGGDACPGANNTYGYGRIDVFEAVSLTLGTRYYDLPWLIAGPVTGVMPPGGSMNIPITFDASTVQPGIYTGGIGIESNDPLLPFTVLPVTLTVYAPCQPIADLSAGFTPFTPTVGEVVTFTASATGTLPISYTWWFVDDDVIATGPVVTHVFTTPNYFYQVVLTAENACDIQHRMLFVLVGGPYRYHLPIISR